LTFINNQQTTLSFPSRADRAPQRNLCNKSAMATAGGKHLGVTPPFSEEQPTELEKKAATDLVDELNKQKNFESAIDTNKRYAFPPVLSHIILLIQSIIVT
jgi:hypothetical protein